MNLKTTLKKIFVPDGGTVALDAHEVWEVRWYSMKRTVKYSGTPSPQCEVFLTQEAANKFSQELLEAARLLKDSCGDMLDGDWRPSIRKNTYTGR
jgi:hypothetical protein